MTPKITKSPCEIMDSLLEDLPVKAPTSKISEWAEENRFLSSKVTAQPGMFRWGNAPYWKEVADCFSPSSSVQTIVVRKGTQAKCTTSIYENVIGYSIAERPTSLLFMFADKQAIQKFKKTKIDQMIDDSGLRKCVTADTENTASRRKGDTVTQLEFSSKGKQGYCHFIGGSNPSDLQALPYQIIMMDEVVNYSDSTKKDGDPCALAEARAATFKDVGKAKIGYMSRPGIVGSCKITEKYEDGDQSQLFVPCPHCGKRQILKFYVYSGGHYSDKFDIYDKKNKVNHKPYGIVFNSAECKTGNYRSVGYKCRFCGEIIKEYHRHEMMRKCQWAPTRKAKYPDYRSFDFSGINVRKFVIVVEKFLKATGDVSKMQVFWNEILGKPFDDKTASVTKSNVYPRRKDFPPNRLQEGVLFVVAACDVQHDRLEVEVKAFGKRFRNWTVDYRVWHGDTANKESDPWAKLRALADERFPGGGWIKDRLVELIVIDSSDGARTHTVYEFCSDSNRDLNADVFYPLKGQDDTAKTRNELRTIKLHEYGLTLLEPYVNLYKNKLSSWLSREWREFEDYPHGWAEFPHVFSDMQNKTIERYLHQLTAEKKVREKVGAVIRYKWKSDGRRNEAFDIFVYCLAAADYYIERTCKDEWQLKDEYGKPAINSGIVFEHLEAELAEDKKRAEEATKETPE